MAARPGAAPLAGKKKPAFASKDPSFQTSGFKQVVVTIKPHVQDFDHYLDTCRSIRMQLL